MMIHKFVQFGSGSNGALDKISSGMPKKYIQTKLKFHKSASTSNKLNTKPSSLKRAHSDTSLFGGKFKMSQQQSYAAAASGGGAVAGASTYGGRGGQYLKNQQSTSEAQASGHQKSQWPALSNNKHGGPQHWKGSSHGGPQHWHGSSHGNQSHQPDDFTDQDMELQDDGGYAIKRQSSREHDWKKRRTSERYKCSPIGKLRRAPPNNPASPVITPSKDHKVFFTMHKSLKPHPEEFSGHHIWDNNHVYMPCSNNNTFKHGKEEKLWEKIENQLANNIVDVSELQEAVLTYNENYKNRWAFEGLMDYFVGKTDVRDLFFEETLPFMQDLALRLPQLVTKPIPLLKQDGPKKLSITQEQAACLLANAFFCTFPKRNHKIAHLPDINFSSLFSEDLSGRKEEKLQCLIHYFNRVREKMPLGVITYTRQVLPRSEIPMWESCDLPLTDLHVSSQGTIEDDGRGMLQVDFANKFVGGGVLGRGLVQEEIRFTICPEMILSRLFTPVLQDNEVLIMTGCERFSSYTGYSDSFKFDGDYKDETERDPFFRLYTQVVAMDALHFRHNPDDQFNQDKINRELTKAYCAFMPSESAEPGTLAAVCTGNWGCGAFKGDKELKALIQIMAASFAGRQVCYFTFHDEDFCDDLTNIHGLLVNRDVSIGSLYELITQYKTRVLKASFRAARQTLFEYIKSALA